MKKLLPWLLLSAACTTWRFQRVEGEPQSVPPTLWQSADCLAQELAAPDYGSCRHAFTPYLACAAHPGLCTSSPDGVAVPVPASATVEFSFVHLGDAAVRERAVVYAPGPYNALSANNRWRRHSDAAVAGLVAAANLLPGAPRFVMHTGNAVGTGLFSELMRFIAAMDVAQLPWFNAIGPRDAAFMGDLPLERVSQLNVVAPYVPIGDAYRFMKYHSKAAAVGDPSMPFAAGRPENHGPTAQPRAFPPSSNFHGFDLVCATTAWCPQMHGYYAFDITDPKGDGLHYRALVLNTAEALHDDAAWGSSRGHLLRAQLEWLRAELADGDPARRFLVFGHHALHEVDDAPGAQLRQALTREPRVLAYLHGGQAHTFATLPRPGGQPLPLLGAGELQRFPQTGRWVEVLRAGDALYLRVQSFSQPNETTVNEEPVDPSYLQVGECVGPSEGTSFCYRLSRTSGDARAAARSLFMGSVEPVQRTSNGVLRVY